MVLYPRLNIWLGWGSSTILDRSTTYPTRRPSASYLALLQAKMDVFAGPRFQISMPRWLGNPLIP